MTSNTFKVTLHTVSTKQETAGWSGCLAQGHLDPQLGGAGARTSNVPFTTSQAALAPEPHATYADIIIILLVFIT